jgi:hypothetical protein
VDDFLATASELKDHTQAICDAWRKGKRRSRRPTLAAALRQASRAGAKVSGATMAPDGSVSLQFGEGNGANETPEDLRKLI